MSSVMARMCVLGLGLALSACTDRAAAPTSAVVSPAHLSAAPPADAGSATEAGAATASVAPDPGLVVPAEDHAEEDARLRALGLTVPEGGLVLERPFEPPYSRRSFVVPQRWFHRRGDSPDPSVLPEKLRADLKILEPLMERAYGGWDSAKARGFDWSGWFAAWDQTLAEAPEGRPMPLAEAFAPVKRLMAFQLDNHTTLPLSLRFGSRSQVARLSEAPSSACTELRTAQGVVYPLDPKDPAQQVRHASGWNAKRRALEARAYIAYPASRGEVSAIHCGSAWIQVMPAWIPPSEYPARVRAVLALSGAQEDGPDLKLLTPTVAYLRLPDFSKPTVQRIAQRQPSWPRPTGKEKVLVVDLRDNGGGDIALEALQGWVEEARLDEAFSKALNGNRLEGASCLYHALRWGYTVISSQGLRPPLGPQFKEMMQSQVAGLYEPSPPDCPRAFKESKGGWGYREHRFVPKPGPVEGHRRILVLVNSGCGSDGELMTSALAALPEAVVVGTNTYGVAQFIQPGYSVLPHTRLPFRIALGRSDHYGDGRSFDGYGFDVDVLLPEEADLSPANILSLAQWLGG